MTVIGAASLTYFCGIAEVDEVTRLVSDALGESLAPEWQRASASVGGRGITVARRLFAPASEFSRTVLGMQNAIRRSRHLSDEGVRQAIAVIDRCDVMLGVVFDPPLSAGDARLGVAESWAAKMEAVVFDGEFVMDATLAGVAQVLPQ